KLAGLRTAILTTDEDGGLNRAYAAWVDETHVGDSLERIPSADLVLLHAGHTDAAAHEYGVRSREYRAEVARVDALIGRIVRTPDPAHEAIVVTSDHGNRREGGHGGTESEVVRIPIVIWGAGAARGWTFAAGRARDVGPTIASLLGVGPLAHATGRSLVGS